MAARLALQQHAQRTAHNEELKREAVKALRGLAAAFNGDPAQTLPNAINFSLPQVDSEAAIVALRDLVALSNGSACTSRRYEPSHVLTAAGYSDERTSGAIRLSWSHLNEQIPWQAITERLQHIATRPGSGR